MPKYNPNSTAPVFQILTGDYPFEIVGVENGISKGSKTNGSEIRTVAMDFYLDETFDEKLATINDTLIDNEKCDWKYSLLARCVGYPLTPNIPFDIDTTWRGYRGWAHVTPEPDRNDPAKKWNRVKVYITDRKPIPPRVIAPDSEADDIPF